MLQPLGGSAYYSHSAGSGVPRAAKAGITTAIKRPNQNAWCAAKWCTADRKYLVAGHSTSGSFKCATIMLGFPMKICDKAHVVAGPFACGKALLDAPGVRGL